MWAGLRPLRAVLFYRSTGKRQSREGESRNSRAVGEKGDWLLLPLRPEGCFAQKVPVPSFASDFSPSGLMTPASFLLGLALALVFGGSPREPSHEAGNDGGNGNEALGPTAFVSQKCFWEARTVGSRSLWHIAAGSEQIGR